MTREKYLETSNSFHRSVGLGKAILHMIGNMIGVGIFIYPAIIASHLPHPAWFFFVWIIGGLIALTGALSSAELGTYYPEAGGDYAYLRHGYGRRWAFVYGFLTFFITFPGSIALGVGLAVHYQGASLLGPWVRDVFFQSDLIDFRLYNFQIISVAIIFILTLLNHRGLKTSFFMQKIMTLLPILFLGLIILLTLIFIFKDMLFLHQVSQLSENFSGEWKMPELIGLGTALVPVYWTFSGWNSPLALGEEIENPQKTIPRAMILGPIFVTLIYMLFCLVFVAVLSYSNFRTGSSDPYFDIGKFLLHNLGMLDATGHESISKGISLILFFIILGNTNSAMITGSRIYVAMARDKLFWQKVGYVDPVKGTPVVSIWLQSFWAIILLLTMDKESNLLNFAFMAITLLSAMTIFSLFIARKKLKTKGSFQAFGYPFTPIFYIVSSLGIMILVAIGYIREGKYFVLYASFLCVAAALIAYEIWKSVMIKEERK